MRLYASTRRSAIYYGLGVTEHSQGSTTAMAVANLALATGNIGHPSAGLNPLRGQKNVQGSCHMDPFPHGLPGCPEYKVTAVQVRRTTRPSDWQARFEEDASLTRLAARLEAAE